MRLDQGVKQVFWLRRKTYGWRLTSPCLLLWQVVYIFTLFWKDASVVLKLMLFDSSPSLTTSFNVGDDKNKIGSFCFSERSYCISVWYLYVETKLLRQNRSFLRMHWCFCNFFSPWHVAVVKLPQMLQDSNISLQFEQLISTLFFLHGEVGLLNEISQKGHTNLGFLNKHSSVDGLLNVYDIEIFCFLDEICLFMYNSALLLSTTQKLKSESGHASNSLEQWMHLIWQWAESVVTLYLYSSWQQGHWISLFPIECKFLEAIILFKTYWCLGNVCIWVSEFMQYYFRYYDSDSVINYSKNKLY